jgi:hypothetical protein
MKNYEDALKLWRIFSNIRPRKRGKSRSNESGVGMRRGRTKKIV